MERMYVFTILSIILGLTAGILAYNQIDGWGWFLFGAIVTFVYPSKNDEE